jgi:peptide/nickel transport system permease protein
VALDMEDPISVGRRRRRWPITLYIGATLVSLFVLVALVSFVWTPYPPNQLNLTNRLASPGTPGFPLGTDRAGRDVVTELMLGARNSLYVSVVSTIVAMVVGASIGLFIAGSHRVVQGPMMRLIDVGLAFPGILIALVLAAKLGAGNTTAVIAIIIWQIPVAARVTVGPARQVLALDFVEAAFGTGDAGVRDVAARALASAPLCARFRHVRSSGSIEAALAYLGVGVQLTSHGDGSSTRRSRCSKSSYLMFFPGLASSSLRSDSTCSVTACGPCSIRSNLAWAL